MWLSLAALVVSLWVVLRQSRRAGVQIRLLCLLLVVQSVSGLPLRLSSSLSNITRAATLGVVALGIMAVLGGTAKPLGTSAKVAGTVATCIATAFLLVRAFGSLSFAVAGWISVVAPILAVAAGTLVRRDASLHNMPLVVVPALLVGVVVNLLFALKQIVFGFSAAEIRAVTSNDSTYSVGTQIRLIGALPSNQDFALYAGVLAPTLLALAIRSSRRNRVIMLVLAVALYLALLLSLSRGAIIGATVAGAGVMIVALHRRNSTVVPLFARLLTIIAVATIAGVLLVPGARIDSAVSRLGSLVRLHEDVSYNARIAATYPVAISTVLHHPFGLGGGAAGPVSQKYPSAAPEGPLTADDAFLTIAIQLGVVGMLLLVVAAFSMIRRLARAHTSAGTAGATALCALLICFVTGGDWNLSGPMSVIAITLGCFAVSEVPVLDPRPVAQRAVRH